MTAPDVIEVHTDPPSVIEVHTDPPSTVEVITAGPPGPQGPPGAAGPGSATVEFTQSTPAAVWGPIAHNLGSRPAAVSVFDLTFGAQFDEFTVQHLDVNTLRIAMDVPTAGIALIS